MRCVAAQIKSSCQGWSIPAHQKDPL